MIFIKTKIEDVYVVEPELRSDGRGYFARIFCLNELRDAGISFSIVQVNQVMTKKQGTIRGPHIQKAPYHEGKIVQCTKGSIFDVAIDLRRDSKTFGAWVGNELSFENKKMILVPKGFAHGYQSLEDNSIVQYAVSEFYHAESVIGVRHDDPFFNIKWPIENPTISEIDKNWPPFDEMTTV